MQERLQTLNFIDWGYLPYTGALARQEELHTRRMHNACGDTVVFTEHPPTYTIGVRPGAKKHLLSTEEDCQRAGIEVVHTNRGGDITYHGPGQIIAYPILSLRDKPDLHHYLRQLEEILIRAVGALGLAASRREGKTGIWIGERKIAAIGIGVRKWVTFHGFALNVNPDLSHFAGIVPCGIVDGSVTSLERELGTIPPAEEIKDLLRTCFVEVLGG